MKLRISLMVCGLLVSCAYGQTKHYLDCSNGNDSADSLAPQTAWRSVAKASSYSFQPGDQLLLKRGSTCEGMLWPKGSGTEQAPIHLGAYGQGALPIVAGGRESAGVKLDNQQYWEMENLEVIGGSPYGIHIGGTEPELRHFRITNIVVHDVPGTPITKDSGLVVIAPDAKAKARISDVIVDGVTAYETSEWAGILVSGSSFDSADQLDRGERMEIRNSVVHDVAGDGILLARTRHGVLEHNLAWYTGMQETQSIGTPNAIWEWRCADCRVEYNEGFFTDSPGVDGGVFDIDYGNENNRVEYNFGHDSQGYCVSVFGAEGPSGNTVQSVVRRNTCIHNGRSPRLAKRQGAMLLYTWDDGTLNGVDISGNTILWDPPVNSPAVQLRAEFSGSQPNRFVGNTIAAIAGAFILPSPGVEVAENRTCGPGGEPAQTLTPSDSICPCVQELIAKANSETQPRSISLSAIGSARLEGSWVLLAALDPPGQSGAAESRSALVVMKSMMQQFAALGLKGVVVANHDLSGDELAQWRADWSIDSRLATLSGPAILKTDSLKANTLLLVSPAGKVKGEWRAPVLPSDVWLTLHSYLGAPHGMQQLPACRGENASGSNRSR